MNPILKAHVSLNVADVDRSIFFYERMFGMAATKVRPGYAKFDVQDPPLNLSLNAASRIDGKGALSHLGLQVAKTDDVIEMRDRWIRSGLKPRDEMQTSCCYALQDKAWVADPDGNEWEVFTVLADVEQRSSESGCCSGNTCCEPEPLVGITR